MGHPRMASTSEVSKTLLPSFPFPMPLLGNSTLLRTQYVPVHTTVKVDDTLYGVCMYNARWG